MADVPMLYVAYLQTDSSFELCNIINNIDFVKMSNPFR